MTEIAERIQREIPALSRRERAQIARFVLSTLDVDDFADDAEFDAELASRLSEIDAGTALGQPVDQVFAELRARRA